MRYKAYRSEPKSSVVTYYEDFSLIQNRTGLTVDTATASVLSGNAVSINTQNYSTATNALAYQVRFSTAGKAVVRITATFQNSNEVKISDYHYTVIDNTMAAAGDYW